MIEQWIERFRRRDRLALSRLITFVSRGEHLQPIRDALSREGGCGPVVAFTGSGGVGKSTLIGKLIDLVRGQGRSIGVLACDPESSLTGGALLGDRVRMTRTPDEGVFIRSLAVPSGRQAIAENLQLMIDLMKDFGLNIVVVETVGAGQGDTAAGQVADVVVLLVQPEVGDDLQWEKAGVLEIADIVVLHKADLPGADRAEEQLRQALNLPGCRQVPIVRASAANNEGLEPLWKLIQECAPSATQARS